MFHQMITVPVQDGESVQLELYRLSNHPEVDASRKRPLILICPGGGYAFRSFREEEPVAIRMLSLGYHAAVLHYDVAPSSFPAQLLQVLACIAFARSNAEEWQVDAQRIVLMGFSAGGHLAASAGVFWSKPYYANRLGLVCEAVKPNALVLCYPVITSGEYAHRGSINHVSGNQAAFLETLSIEKQVSSDTPPCFVWHTQDDDAVPVENTLLFVNALQKKQIPYEMHIFQKGAHGLSLANAEVYPQDKMAHIQTRCAQWVDLMASWLQLL